MELLITFLFSISLILYLKIDYYFFSNTDTEIFRVGFRLMKSDHGDWAMVMGMKCFGHQFLFVLEKKEVFPGSFQFYAVAKLIGSPREAQQFVCK